MTRRIKAKRAVALRKRAKKKLVEPFELLALLIDAVGAEYHKDPTRAGVVVAKLADGNHYVSVVRYTDSYGGGKKKVLSRSGPDLGVALRLLAKDWHTLVTPPPIVDLVKKLGAALA